ncbi:MAG: cell wall-active antibiotics response protein, partial [bacterium]|nr:cell wall-active antibiotics response protein [bacterium]
LANAWAAFGDARLVSKSHFQGGEVLAVFGDYELDLRHARLAADEVVLRANAVFGGVEIKVPPDWDVLMRGTPVFGGFEDKTVPRAEDPTVKRPLLIVKGTAMFGAVEISN